VEDPLVEEVLAALGVTTGPVRELVMQRLGPGSGPRTEGQLPFSALSKKVLEVSLRESLSLGHQHIGPEHLLLGLARVSEGGASQILRELGADAKNVQLEVRRRVPGPIPAQPVNVATLPRRQTAAPVTEFRPAADQTLRRVLMVAAGLAMTDARETFGVGDLLHAFARDPELSQLLIELGVDLELLRERFGHEPPAAGEAPAGGSG
jgi:ATP-dependent Clp protease ATP-binding subunit ClpA